MCFLWFSFLNLPPTFFFFWSISKCSNTTLFKVYFLAVFFFFFFPSLSVSFFNIWDRRILSKSEGKEEEDLLQEGFLSPSTRKLNTATTALKGMVYVPTALSRQALYFFANRINFKLKSVDS